MCFYALRVLAKSNIVRKRFSAILGTLFILRVGTAIFTEVINRFDLGPQKTKVPYII
jgi:hypothetical protein